MRKRDGEDVGRRAAVPLGMTDVVDAEGRLGVVVANRVDTGAIGDGGVDPSLRPTANASSASNLVSPWTRTVTVWLVRPGANVTVPAAA